MLLASNSIGRTQEAYVRVYIREFSLVRTSIIYTYEYYRERRQLDLEKSRRRIRRPWLAVPASIWIGNGWICIRSGCDKHGVKAVLLHCSSARWLGCWRQRAQQNRWLLGQRAGGQLAVRKGGGEFKDSLLGEAVCEWRCRMQSRNMNYLERDVVVLDTAAHDEHAVNAHALERCAGSS